MKKNLHLLSLLFFSLCAHAQTSIVSVNTSYAASGGGNFYSGPFATGGNSVYNSGTFQYRFGTSAGTTNNILSLLGFSTATSNYVPVATNPTIILRRNSTNPNNSILFYKGIAAGASGGFTNVFNLERPYEESMEVVFSGLNNFNAGTDNIFTNVGDGNGNNNNIERLDVVFTTPRMVVNAAKEGVAVFERGEINAHDGFKIAIIKSIDGSNNPTSYYTTTKTIVNGSYGNTNLITSSSDIDYFVLRKPLPSANELRISASAQQNMGGVFLKFSDFGILNNETVVGYSILPEDVVVTNGTSVLNYNNVNTSYITNTNNADGGLDLVAVTAIYEETGVAALNEMELSAYTDMDLVKLEWKNSNPYLYNIEVQKSIDGLTFNTIFTEQPNSTHEYTYSDIKTSAVNFYRIKFNTVQGGFAFSNIVKVVSVNKNEQFQLLSSNPVIGNTISLKIKATARQESSIVLYNSLGQVLLHKIVTVQKGDNFITIEKPSIYSGFATMVLKMEGVILNKQLVF
jgi:hypothetical protein